MTYHEIEHNPLAPFGGIVVAIGIEICRLLRNTGQESGFGQRQFAGIFAGFGSEVSLAYRADLPLRGFDDDIRSRLATAMADRGVALRPGFSPVKLERTANGLRCTAKDGQVIEADVVLSALGRRPNTDGLGLAEAGVEIDEKSGAIRV